MPAKHTVRSTEAAEGDSETAELGLCAELTLPEPHIVLLERMPHLPLQSSQLLVMCS